MNRIHISCSANTGLTASVFISACCIIILRRLMICRTRRHAECITAPQHRARQMCGFHLLPPPWCMLCFRLSAPLSAYRAPSVWVTWYRVACICSALPPCCLPAPPTPFLSGAGSIPHPGRVCGVPLRVSEGTRIRKLYRFPQIKKKPPLMVRQHPGADFVI